MGTRMLLLLKSEGNKDEGDCLKLLNAKLMTAQMQKVEK